MGIEDLDPGDGRELLWARDDLNDHDHDHPPLDQPTSKVTQAIPFSICRRETPVVPEVTGRRWCWHPALASGSPRRPTGGFERGTGSSARFRSAVCHRGEGDPRASGNQLRAGVLDSRQLGLIHHCPVPPRCSSMRLARARWHSASAAQQRSKASWAKSTTSARTSPEERSIHSSILSR